MRELQSEWLRYVVSPLYDLGPLYMLLFNAVVPFAAPLLYPVASFVAVNTHSLSKDQLRFPSSLYTWVFFLLPGVALGSAQLLSKGAADTGMVAVGAVGALYSAAVLGVAYWQLLRVVFPVAHCRIYAANQRCRGLISGTYWTPVTLVLRYGSLFERTTGSRGAVTILASRVVDVLLVFLCGFGYGRSACRTTLYVMASVAYVVVAALLFMRPFRLGAENVVALAIYALLGTLFAISAGDVMGTTAASESAKLALSIVLLFFVATRIILDATSAVVEYAVGVQVHESNLPATSNVVSGEGKNPAPSSSGELEQKDAAAAPPVVPGVDNDRVAVAVDDRLFLNRGVNMDIELARVFNMESPWLLWGREPSPAAKLALSDSTSSLESSIERTL
jgi:hypothetical protein